MSSLFVLAMAGVMGAMKNFGHLGHLHDVETDTPPPVVTGRYILEDSSGFYTTEDGSGFYILE